MAEEGEDWLFPEAKEQRAAVEEKGLVFAQKYLVFSGPTSDPRACELLNYWTTLTRRARIPAGASAQEYAAHNAFRELIEGIWTQIEFAQQGQNLPKARSR